MSVRQVVERFGRLKESGQIDWTNISDSVKTRWQNAEYETWIDLAHHLSPNPDYNPKKLLSRYKKFYSCYYEIGMTNGTNTSNQSVPGEKLLSEKGYDFFPVLCPRWETTGEDSYGTSCPGMESVGANLALQLMHKRKAEAIEKMVRPPLKGPTSLRTSRVSQIPGDVTYTDERSDQGGLKPIYEVSPRIQELVMDIQEHQSQIKRAFYEDLFLMLSTSDRRDFTAREIDERHEEKLLALGPVLEQLNQDLFDPLIDNTFDIMMARNLIPDPPPELHGQTLKVEYTSIMAQAQKMVGIAGIERFFNFAGRVIQVSPQSAAKLDLDQALDIYGDMTSVPPGLIVPDDKVAQIRQQQAQQAQAQQKMAAIQQGAGAAKDLSQADLGGDNALSQLMSQQGQGVV
jgi:hypothetical protein